MNVIYIFATSKELSLSLTIYCNISVDVTNILNERKFVTFCACMLVNRIKMPKRIGMIFGTRLDHGLE